MYFLDLDQFFADSHNNHKPESLSLHKLKTPMKIFTPVRKMVPSGPSEQTLLLIRQFARLYRPYDQAGQPSNLYLN